MALNKAYGTIGDLTPSLGEISPNHAYYAREFIEVANPELFYDKWGMQKPIPKNNSNQIVFNKVNKLSTLESSPLSEGVTPVEQQLQLVRISQTVNQYGGYATTTDRLSDESINGVTSEFNKRLGEQGGETMNKVVRDDLSGSTNVRYANGAASRVLTSAAPAAADFDYMIEALRTAKAKPIAAPSGGSQNFNTNPIAEGYPCVVPVTAIGEIEALDDGEGNTFQPVETYMSAVNVWPNEFGRYKQTRFIFDTEAYIATGAGAAGVDIAVALLFGKGAYGVSNIGASDVNVIVKPLGSGGTNDPLNQRATIGWKANKAAVVVQPTYMFRFEFKVV